MTRAHRVGVVMWLLQPVLIAVELIVAVLAASPAVPLPTLLWDRSVSDLGADRNT